MIQYKEKIIINMKKQRKLSKSLVKGFTYGTGKLICTGGGFHSAGVSLELFFYLGNSHSIHQLGHSLKITVTAPDKRDITDYITFYIEGNGFRAGTLCFIGIFHGSIISSPF